MKDHHQNRLNTLNRLSALGVGRNELLADVVAVVIDELLGFELEETHAVLVGNAVADRLADYWGGQTIGFPRDAGWLLGQKELAIYDMFRGDNREEVIRFSGMTDRGFAKLIKRIRERLVRQARKTGAGQGDMFLASKSD